jgi:hypothetical protein
MHELASRALFEAEVAKLDKRHAQVREWIIHSLSYPLLDVSFTAFKRTTLRLRLICTNWNSEPPSAELCDSEGVQLASPWPDPNNPSGIFNQGPHPTTGLPFICMRGIREYHIHSSHINDHWDSHRQNPDNSLLGLVFQIWDGWRKGKD